MASVVRTLPLVMDSIMVRNAASLATLSGSSQDLDLMTLSLKMLPCAVEALTERRSLLGEGRFRASLKDLEVSLFVRIDMRAKAAFLFGEALVIAKPLKSA